VFLARSQFAGVDCGGGRALRNRPVGDFSEGASLQGRHVVEAERVENTLWVFLARSRFAGVDCGGASPVN